LVFHVKETTSEAESNLFPGVNPSYTAPYDIDECSSEKSLHIKDCKNSEHRTIYHMATEILSIEALIFHGPS
jgi:hypothetical protein